MGFAFAYFPVICLIASVALVIYGIWRKKNKLPCLQTFISCLLYTSEQLKDENQIEWVRQMNACVAQAEETIKGELIYCEWAKKAKHRPYNFIS